MAKYTVKNISNKKVWEKYLLSQNPKSFLQSWNWGETNKLVGDKIIRLGFYEKNKLIGICLMIKQRAKRGTHFLIPGGPIIDWDNVHLVKYVFSEIKEIAKKDKVWFVRIRPEIKRNIKNRTLLRKHFLISSPIHLHAENTWILNIEKNEDQILMEMRKNTRYAVRKSFKEKFTLEKSSSSKDTNVLVNLQKETVKRHGFVGFKKEVFDSQMNSFGKNNQANLFMVNKDGIPQVVAMIIFYGDTAYYHHSGSSEVARKTNASYFLQWEVIKEAKRRGCKYYNLWGVAPDKNPKHRFAGVSIFKKGFGGEQIDWLHAHDIIISPKYWLTYLFENVRSYIRKV